MNDRPDDSIQKYRKALDYVHNEPIVAAGIIFKIADVYYKKKNDDQSSLVELEKGNRWIAMITNKEKQDEFELLHDLQRSICLNQIRQTTSFLKCARSILSRFSTLQEK